MRTYFFKLLWIPRVVVSWISVREIRAVALYVNAMEHRQLQHQSEIVKERSGYVYLHSRRRVPPSEPLFWCPSQPPFCITGWTGCQITTSHGKRHIREIYCPKCSTLILCFWGIWGLFSRDLRRSAKNWFHSLKTKWRTMQDGLFYCISVHFGDNLKFPIRSFIWRFPKFGVPVTELERMSSYRKPLIRPPVISPLKTPYEVA